ncbi:MAG: aspartate-semialdehyde dehydrogenase [Burkholderiales bacterium]|nr:aspartate-semialdehyde dehydrogenase [Burkholderiales bacterium]
MLKVGFIGWRGMVGSVLMKRMREENDFAKITPVFFSTSAAGGKSPDVGKDVGVLRDAFDVSELAKLDCILTTQGSEYTHEVLPKLRDAGWNGYWIDAASALRMKDDSIIVLDPINRAKIDEGIKSGVKNYIGGNCTVSLMLLGLDGLFKADLVEWISSMTYQAASGAGANNIRELLTQCGVLNSVAKDELLDRNSSILDIDAKVTDALRSKDFPQDYFGAPLAGSVIPWIDAGLENGQTKEEWKGCVEANKILGYMPNTVKVDGICVRVGVLRSHSQALTIKLKRKDLSLEQIEQIIQDANPWVKFVANNKPDTLSELTPASVSGTLDIAVGRLKRLSFGDDYISIFTVGDQLLWGAAEPLRRMLNILAGNDA